MPLKANEVESDAPFTADELLYRRVNPEELNSKGEVDPSWINVTSFTPDVESAPSVNRGKFSEPDDVLHHDCAQRDTTDWKVFYVRVDSLPERLVSGDGKRSFDFYPKHIPLEQCGAHSVVASCITGDVNKAYVKPSDKVARAFKAHFAVSLKSVPTTA